MAKLSFPHPDLDDKRMQENLELLSNVLGPITQRIFAGRGDPAVVMPNVTSSTLFFRLDGAAGSSLYLFEPGSGWKAL